MNDEPDGLPLDAYPDLDPPGRAALSARLRASGEAADLPAAERLARSVDATRTQTPENRLADLVATQHAAGQLPDDEAAELVHLVSDPALAPAYAAMRERLRALDAADPVARFERLRTQATPAVETGEPLRARKSTPDRDPAMRARTARPRWARALALAGAAFALVAGAVLALRGPAGGAGAFTDEELSLEGYGPVRSGPGEEAVPAGEQRYLRALRTIADARSPFGYDGARLRVARTDLEAVVRGEEAGSFLELEASYALGKTALLLGDEGRARTALSHVVRGGGMRSSEAARILATIGALPPRS